MNCGHASKIEHILKFNGDPFYPAEVVEQVVGGVYHGNL